MTSNDVRTSVIRRIIADPTSTALLLAGPAAMDLWPGLRRVGEADGRVLVETALSADGVSAGSVRALPPHRTPTSYVTRFQTCGPGLPEVEGTLTLGYVVRGDEVLTTVAQLDLRVAGPAGSTLSEQALHVLGAGFLDNLAVAAESRSRAA